MVTVSYDYYSGTFGGTLDKDTFERLEPRVMMLCNMMTDWKLEERYDSLSDVRKSCVMGAVCAGTDVLAKEETGGPVSSETNDGISVSYAVTTSTKTTAEGRVSETLRFYLASTGLLYRGRCF